MKNMKQGVCGKRIYAFLLACLVVAACLPGYASVKVHVQYLTTADGLSNNSVRYIYQDSKGFIWMSSLNGLNRYDGNSFRTFLPENKGRISLTDRRVKHLYEDGNGFLWISTSADRFSCYDLKKDCFVDFTGCGEYEDHYGYITILPDAVWLWGRGQGCRRVRYRDGKFVSEVFDVGSGQLRSDNVQFVLQDAGRRVWIGTDKGLYFWQSGALQCADQAHCFQRAYSFGDKACFITAEGEIWSAGRQGRPAFAAKLPGVSSGLDLPGNLAIGSRWVIFTSKGSFVFEPEGNVLKPSPAQWNIPGGEVSVDNRGNYWVHNGTGKLYYIRSATGVVKVFQLMPREKVGYIDMERYHVVHDSRDILWISTYGNGLFTYDLRTDELRHFKADDSRSSLISSNALQYVMEDRSGSIWLSSEYTGVSHLKVVNEGAVQFYPEPVEYDTEMHVNNVRMLAAGAGGDVYLGTRDGKVYVYDAALSRLKKKEAYSKNIYALCEDTAGTLWLGSRGDGLYVGGKRYAYRVDDASSVAADEIFCMLHDRKGRMWVGTFGGGLDLAVPDGKGGYRFRHFFDKYYSQKRIRALIEDRQGWIWAGTSDGIFVFRPEELLTDSKAYHHYNWSNRSLLSNEVRHIMQDSKGNIWIAESGAGFSVCTPGTDYGKLEFAHYGVADGLVNSMVQAFVEDEAGRVWITTEYGVSCFFPQSKTFENYFFSSDMLSNVYSEGCVLRLQDGRIIMGTNQGLTVVDPSQVESVQRTPSVTFTELKLNGISVASDDPNSPLEYSLAYARDIRLRYNQNSFGINFSTLDYSTTIPPKFSYKLEGYDKEWSTPSALTFAAYKNLKPGTYDFHVKACNAAGQWAEQDTTLRIVIAPPFWRTGWAYLLYTLLVAFVLYTVWRIVRNMNDLRNKIKVEEQLTEYKLVFFTNISHEFRTPLTLIQAALEKMHRVGKIPKEMAYSVKVMDKSTRRMLRLINQLLEFRKMQNDKLALSLEETDVIAFLYEIYLSFGDAAESKKMDFRFIPSIASYKMFIDKGNLDKVTYNLLSNAFKYTPSGGKIDFSVQVDAAARKLVVRVADSGVGIPKEKRDQLFKRFMQSNFSGSSVGVGLHLTHELVSVHKGTITYDENPGGGSVFTVVLSTDASVYEEKDFLIPNNVLLREEEMAQKHLADMERDERADAGKSADTEKEDIREEGMPVAPLNKRRLLVIEDDTDVREFLKEELSVYFEVVAEADGNAGLERACSYDADLIICDVLMPGLSGFEVTRKLKGDFNTSHIPIILLTALNAPESHLEGVESGADAYITKPFSTKLLLARVFKLIEQRDKLREKFSSDLSMVRPVICTTDKDREFTDKLTRIVEEQLENPDFTVDEFASMMSLGRTIFYRKVKGVTGYAPKEYLRVMRMKKAAELLLKADVTVAEVAYQVGINDPFYFSKCFKAQFGMSPSAYQKDRGDAGRDGLPLSGE